jgi:hypothetical protein
MEQARALHTGVETLSITYVPSPVYPASSGANFVWGSSAVSAPELDKCMVVMAASELKIKEGEMNAGIEKRKEELRAAVLSRCDIPCWRSMPMGRTCMPVWWHYAFSDPHTMQLVEG